MRKTIIPATILFLTFSGLNSQTIEIPGKPTVEIFTDFHYNAGDPGKFTGFSVNRAYFGYTYKVDENFSALIRIDIGTPEDLVSGSKPRRYAFFRDASINYSKDKLSITLGITGTRLFDYQQRFWGLRYLASTYQSLNGYGFVADLGLVVNYKFNDKIEADFTLMNGEGYSNLQLDNNLKSSLGITVTPIKQLVFRMYSDLMKQSGLWQNTLIGFAGFRNDFFSFGAEISHKTNLDLTKGHDAWGISGTGSISLTKKIDFFTRYDYSTSVIAPGDVMEWNYSKDGTFLITGFQYTFNKIVKIALDYQAGFPVDASKSSSKLIFLNALFKF
jgi:hypothetical protein